MFLTDKRVNMRYHKITLRIIFRVFHKISTYILYCIRGNVNKWDSLKDCICFACVCVEARWIPVWDVLHQNFSVVSIPVRDPYSSQVSGRHLVNLLFARQWNSPGIANFYHGYFNCVRETIDTFGVSAVDTFAVLSIL